MKKILLTIILVASASLVAQSSNSLLWKATQKGKRPIYLYGTIHIRDKAVFNLSDSTYTAIKSAELVAGELDLENMMYEIFENLYSKDTSNLLSKKMDPKKFQELKSDISNSSGVDISHMDAKHSWMIDLLKDRHEWKTDENKSKETFLDAYIIRLAQQWGKHTGGIERMDDYSEIASAYEKTGESSVTETANSEEDFNEAAQQYLLNLYLSEDIRELFALTDKSMNDYEKYSLRQRNYNMVKRLDSIAGLQRIFFAVGAAHLSGKTGLIELLKQKGYELTPVKCNTSTLIKQQELSKIPYSWKPFTPSSKQYSLEMPKKHVSLPYAQEGITGEIFLAPDIFNNTYFMAIEMKVPYTITPDNAEVLLDRFADNFANRSNTTKLSSSKNQMKEFPSLNILTKSHDLYYNNKIYLLHNKIIFLSVYGTKKNVQSEDALHYLNSFAYLNFSYAKISEGMKEVSDSIAAITLLMPENFEASGPFEGESMSYYVRNASAKEGGFYYLVYDFKKETDSELEEMMISGTAKALSGKKEIEKLIERDTVVLGNHQAFYGEYREKEKKSYINMLMFFRDNRMYQFYSESKGQAEGKEKFRQIIASVALQPYTLAPSNTFLTSDSVQLLADSEPDSANFEYQYNRYLPTLSFHDSKSGIQTELKTKTTSPYLVVKNPEAYLFGEFRESRISGESSDTITSDPIIWDANGFKKTYYAYSAPESRKLERIIDSTKIQRSTLYQTNGNLFILNNTVTTGYEKSPCLDKIHNSLTRISKPQPSKDFSALLSDLNNKDTSVSFKAYDDMEGASIDEKEFPVLQKALSQTYDLDQLKPQNYYEPIRERLITIVLESKPKDYEPFLARLFSDTKDLSLRRAIISSILSTFEFGDSVSTSLMESIVMLGLPIELDRDSNLVQKIQRNYFSAPYISYCKRLIKQSTNPEYEDWIVMTIGNFYKDSIQRMLVEENKTVLQEMLLRSYTQKLSDTNYRHKADVLTLIGLLKSDALLPLVALLRDDQDDEIREKVCMTEIKVSGACDPAVLDGVCKNPLLRYGIYCSLKEQGQINLFPVQYNKQELLAESIFWTTLYTDEEFTLEECIQIGLRKKKVNGKKGIQYLYRFRRENEMEWYYGVSGIYADEISLDSSDYASYSCSEEYLGEKASVLFKRIDKQEKKYKEYQYEF